ncbi:GTP cyclohydrolase-2 [Campylobacterota bacterium]|nr:GTP cyclohydrolase-2 [Campylobacterota bacterium]
MQVENIQISQIANLPTKHGLFKVQAFREESKDHLLIRTENLSGAAPLIRIHSECLTGDALFSRKCDCGEQLDMAMAMIAQVGCGAILYLRQEGRNIGLFNKINAYALQDGGLDTIEANHQLGFKADERTYEIAEFMLEHLGLTQIRLLTNNPLKLESFKTVAITARVPLIVKSNQFNEEYLRVKKEKGGHLL